MHPRPRAAAGAGKACLAGIALLPVSVSAIQITDYSPAAHNRFASGFNAPDGTAPAANIATAFIGAAYDFSGVGWQAGTGAVDGSRVRNTTLVTPLHIIEATHLGASPGTVFRFLARDGVLHRATLLRGETFSTTTYSNDLRIGTLDRPFATSDRVAPLRILDIRAHNYIGLPLFIYGSNADELGPRVASAVGTGIEGYPTGNVPSWDGLGAPGSAILWESGDSGSPALVRYSPPGGAPSLTFGGPAWTPRGFSTILGNGVLYDPVSGINAILRTEGYALRWTIYDNPADPPRTAAQWTGAAGTSALSTPKNWSQSLDSAGRPVLFDSASSPSTSLALDGALAIRGLLFKASASPAGFTLSGSGTLTLGATGLRNESAATQTISLPITLSESQNWESEGGPLVFERAIDTTSAAHLLSIGGAGQTALAAPLVGAGALAKDGTGTLLLSAANTYVGKTWIHAGTLRLGPAGGLPSTTEVIFDTTDPAVLDLAGRDQTLAGLRTVHGAAARVELGSGTLTVNNASTSAARVSISGSGGLAKNGNTLLSLETANTYAGPTTINNGVVRVVPGALPASSNLVLDGGGVLELGAGMPDFTASLGTGAGQVRFLGGGGFSAIGGDRFVNLGGATPALALVWGQTPHFIPNGGFLILSSSFADSTIDFRNPVILGTSGSGTRSFLASNGSAAVDARISGDLSSPGGNYGINKYNTGTLELTGANSYPGPTSIYAGALRLGSVGALPAASNVILAGGILELAAGDLDRVLGTGTGQLAFTAGGGFSAAGANRVVNLGDAAIPRPLSWGQANFVPSGASLLLSSAGADATLDFRNPLDLGASGSGQRTVQVDNGGAAVDARLSGDLFESGGSFGLLKLGTGTLELTGANTYSGETRVGSGVLRLGSTGALSPHSNIQLNGGVLEFSAGDCTAPLGAGPGQVRFGGSAGFSAAGATRFINLGGAATPATLAWESTHFLTAGQILYLSSAGSDATVVFRNPLLLGSSGSALRGISVNDGAAAVDARLAGELTQSGGTFGITKYGNGTLELAGANNYTGRTRIIAGVLRLSSAGALPTASPVVLAGGMLELAHGNYSATIGTAAGNLLFAGHGGFSAVGGARTVTLNGGATLVWGDGTGIDRGFNLLLSSPSADSTIEFQNPLQLTKTGPTQRIVQVADGSAAIDARLNGVISQLSGEHGLTKLGNGTLELTAANSYRGSTLVEAGALFVHGDQIAALGACRVATGATLGGTGRLGGDLGLASGSRLALSRRNGATRGPTLKGSVTFGGPVAVTADTLGSAILPGTYTLLAYDGARIGAPVLSWVPPAGSTLRADFDLSQTGRIQITLTEFPPLQLWRETHFGADASPELSGDAADPDADGQPNLLEYALGADPLDPDPISRVVIESLSGRLRLTFSRVADPALVYEVQAANDLVPANAWQTVWSSTGAQNTAGPVSVDDVVTLAARPARFLRLRVSAP